MAAASAAAVAGLRRLVLAALVLTQLGSAGKVGRLKLHRNCTDSSNEDPWADSPCPHGCYGRGSCDTRNNFCWCDPGFGGLDCSKEAPLTLDVTAIGPPEFQEALGRYKVDAMYLSESSGSNGQIRVIQWSDATSGWVISEFGSPCADDVCFFGYQRKKTFPPEKGYVYGGPDFQVYVDKMVYDYADDEPNIKPGYHLSVEYTPDPHVEGVPDLSILNGRYVLQPRYVHEATGKFAIMPIDFKAQRTWVLAGLVGVPRKWHVLETSAGAALDMYTVPTTVGTHLWQPMEDGLQIVERCVDHLPSSACGPLASQCGFALTTVALAWLRDCCRSTCGSCERSRTACQLPATETTSLLALAAAAHNGSSSASGPTAAAGAAGAGHRHANLRLRGV